MDIRDASKEALAEFLEKNGEKKFRTNQIEEWLWKKGVRKIDDMTTLSLSLRELLKKNFTFKNISIFDKVESKDKTVKFDFILHDNLHIEGVLIPSISRTTACLSIQVGCAMGCKFCATGEMGLKRDLSAGEIFDQFILLNKMALEIFDKKIDNIVYMGMGEPLKNYNEVMKSIYRITSPEGQGLSPSRITLSTVGLPAEIRQLGDDNFAAGLAISLHQADNKKRQEIIPIAKKYSLDELQKAIIYFHEKTGQRVTIEYLLLENVNDSLHDAENLAVFCRAFPVKINLIQYNSTNSFFKGSNSDKIRKFAEYLENKNIIINVRKSKGDDIAAACGQLIHKNKK